MTRYRIILNPVAGRGRGARSRAVVEQVFTEAGVDFSLAETSGPGDAVALACAAALEGYQTIVTVGGDGTAHEALQGMILAAQAEGRWQAGQPVGTLAMVPVGTGNDYAWRLGIPENDPLAACRAILTGRPRTVDIGQVTDEQGQVAFFVNHLGGGFEAAANIESRRMHRLRGLLLYLAAVLRVIPQYSRGRLTTISYNGTQETRPILLASVSNGGRSGGGFKIAPDARLDDGLLDLVLADSPNVAIILWLLPKFLAGTHGSQKKYVMMGRSDHVVIETPVGIPVHLDGEIFRDDARRLEVRALPGRLIVIGAGG